MKIIIILLLFALIQPVFGQNNGVWMHSNKGQWSDPILYKVELQMGEMFIEPTGFTFSLNDFKQKYAHHHQAGNHHDHSGPDSLHSQIIRTTYLGSSWNGEVEEKIPSTFYRNYYQGNDPSRWKSNVHSYQNVALKGFYPQIDLVLEGETSQLKYSFLVYEKANANQIRWEIAGANSIRIDQEGRLHIENRFGEIVEEKPIAWNLIEGRKKEVRVRFVLENNVLSFEFPEGYSNKYPLVIDPSLTFSTFTGSTSDNWGMTATPDHLGNLIAGGIVFDDGGIYPTTPGSYDASMNGGDVDVASNLPGFDIGITKFSSDGTALLFSTFIGGSANEAPHSLVCNANNELYVMGVTASPNFPTTAGAYDPTFNGGPEITENELYYNGADLFVSKLNANGTALLASTYLGGSGTDGVNIGTLNYNYGDPFRGEIIDGENGFIYVSSTTQSPNFPTVNASQNTLSGTQDAVVLKMNSSLSSISWSTYFGGTGLETGNSIQLSSLGGVFVAGGTTSSNLPINTGEDLTFNGGISDGFLAHFNGTTGAVQEGTYMGMNEYDQAYFVQLDDNNDVYVFGQSESSWPITAGLYGTANSGQFIRKYSSNLSTILWTTMIGAGTGSPEISPTAFLVSNCYDIYLSGWGGTINQAYSNQAHNSTTNGFQTTSDAFQSATNGSNFYIAVLSQNAASLKYATFMGGITSSYGHVDGGTSRFDKSGTIYHAVCGACGGDNFGFTTSPGVVGPENLSANCNLAAFKFALNKIEPIVGYPNTLICYPDPVEFTSSSAFGNTFHWDFGDNTTSTELNPIHYYQNAGDYTIVLVISDSSNCYSADSILFDISIGDFEGIITLPPTPVCPGTPYQLVAGGGATYSWTPVSFLDNPTSATPTATIDQTTEFTVIISDSCGTDTLTVTLEVYDLAVIISKDTSICIGQSVPLIASGGNTYQWVPGTYLDNPNIPTPISTPSQTIEYQLNITTPDNCLAKDSVTIRVFYEPPVSDLIDSIKMCSLSEVSLEVSGAESYLWSPDNQINTLVGSQVIVSPLNDFTYHCLFQNACGSTPDSVVVDVIFPIIIAGTDTIICHDETANLWARGGISYVWEPGTTVSSGQVSEITVNPDDNTQYIVTGTDIYGCSDTASVWVRFFAIPTVQTKPSIQAFFGEQVQLEAEGSTEIGSYMWSPGDYLDCSTCQLPLANPDHNFLYTVTFTDENGCVATNSVRLEYAAIIFVPNTFTPGKNQIFNSIFKAEGSNIKSFTMHIYNRWGEMVYEGNDLNAGWDGTYKGKTCQQGTYTWNILYADLEGKKTQLTGHINLLR